MGWWRTGRGWARRSKWAVMAGFRVREKGVCLFLPGEGRRRQWRLLTAQDSNGAELEHAGRKQVNAGLMGISIAALKQSCKQWKAVRAIL